MALLDADKAAAQPRLKRLWDVCVNTPPIAIGQIATLPALIGLSLLYASAYYLPLLRPAGAYFLPSGSVIVLVVFPTLVTVAAVLAAYYLLRTALQRWSPGGGVTIFAVLVLSLLAVIAIKGVFSAADSDWRNVVPLKQSLVSPILLTTIQRIKFTLIVCVLLAFWAMRNRLARLTRFLSSIGFAFAGLALVRILILSWSASHASGQFIAPSALAEHTIGRDRPADSGHRPTTGAQSRRVIWVIFDETDFNRVFTQDPAIRVSLPNFTRLAQSAVTAAHANSPAGATIYSIPALLTGIPVAGLGVRFNDSATLSVEQKNGQLVPFEEPNSIFGLLEAEGRTASILGFYHPYCRLFKVARCDSFPWPKVGGWGAALEANLPDSVSSANTWDSITGSELKLLPEYLSRDDDLTFIHLNFPHPPANYADRVLHLPASPNPSVEYSHNLLFADRVLGQIMQELRNRGSRRELLLIVSTDHWLRNRWFKANEKEISRPIPFFAWRIGEATGQVMPQPISTVHTAAMILDYLRGNISTQADIANWWKNQAAIPSFIPN